MIYFPYKIPRYSIGKYCLKYLIISRDYLSLHSLHWKAGDQFLRLSKPKRNENVSYLDICMRCLSVIETTTTKNLLKNTEKKKYFLEFLLTYYQFIQSFIISSVIKQEILSLLLLPLKGSLINQPFFTCGSPKFLPLLVSHRAISSNRSMQSQPVFSTCTQHWVFCLCEGRKD